MCLALVRTTLLLTCLLLTACSAHRPGAWKLASRNATAVLVPPDVAKADLTHRTLKVNIARSRGDCPPGSGPVELRLRRKDARVTISSASLAAQPRGWLGNWAFQLEEDCLAPGDGMKLAGRIAESVPLEPGAAFNLLYSDDRQTGVVDIGAGSVLKVVSPLLRDPSAGIMADGPTTVTGNGYSLTVTGKFTDNLIGYETAFYSVEPAAKGIGYTIKVLHADRHVDGKVDRTPQPAVNHFRFANDAAFYRLIYKSWLTEFTALMLAAHTPAELDQRTRMLERDGTSASCEKLAGMCIAVPRAVAVHPMTSIEVNGSAMLVPRGATLLYAIRSSGAEKPESVLAQLSVGKPWNGKPVPVKFAPDDPAILKLVLQGGETIRWK